MTPDITKFTQIVADTDNFTLRRVVERLREGLFDPFGVKMLTAHEHQLNTVFDRGARDLSRNKATHLCVCGAYGQGKSHSLTYLKERALGRGFVASLINLDPREVPLHNFRQVYRALVNQITFPDSTASLVKTWNNWAKEHLHDESLDPLSVIPDDMPHPFKATLTALAKENIALSKRQRTLKKHATFRPREFPWILANALNGNAPPVFRLRHALKYRQVDFYKNESLVCKGWEPYFELVRTLALLFKRMGYNGWVLLFDEAESIVQTRINARRNSYLILDRLFRPETPLKSLFPIFAFTNDFFTAVQNEDYDRIVTRNEKDLPYFPENYAQAWRQLTIHDLNGLSANQWQSLSKKLILFHANAYGWQPPDHQLQSQLAQTLSETSTHEPRLKLKALVNQLDFVHQETVLK